MDSTIPDTVGKPAGSEVTPHLSMGRVVLTVNDLDRVRAFYEQAVGLHPLRSDGTAALLGAGDEVLLELRQDRAARRRSPREAGLFHTAFLLPRRADLARWTRHAVETRAPVVGASDHAVSEAIYLSDPEGNGVEIYTDRPVLAWKWKGDQVEMTSDPLDLRDLLSSADDKAWTGFPQGSTVGHVHLQVGALPPAEAFYAGVLGLGITCHYPGGTFYAAGGYHHHVATNIWNSRGAGPREYPSTGLAEMQVRIDPVRAAAIAQRAGVASDGAQPFPLPDPWGTVVTIAPSVKV